MNITKTRLTVAFAAAALLTLGACTTSDNTPVEPPTHGQGDESLPLITDGTPSDWMDGEPEPVQPPDYTTPVTLTFKQIAAAVKGAVPGATCDTKPFFDLEGVEKIHCFLEQEGAQVLIAKFEQGESNRADVEAMTAWKHYAEWPTFSIAGVASKTDWAAIVEAVNEAPGATS